MSYGGVFADDWDQYIQGAGINAATETKVLNSSLASNQLTLQGDNCRKFDAGGGGGAENNVCYLVKDSSYNTSDPLELSMLWRMSSVNGAALFGQPAIHLRAAETAGQLDIADYYQVVIFPTTTTNFRYMVTGMTGAISNLYWVSGSGVAQSDWTAALDDWNFFKARIEANGANQRIKVWVAHGLASVDLASEVVGTLALDVEHVDGSFTPTIHVGTPTGSNWLKNSVTASGRLGFSYSSNGATIQNNGCESHLDSVRVANS